MRKRLVMLVTFFFLVVFMAGCFSPADSVGIPKGYIEKEEYYDKDGFQDYTDYAKYIYSSKDIIVNDDKYFEIKEEDISNIKFENMKPFLPYYPERIYKNMYEVGLLNGVSAFGYKKY